MLEQQRSRLANLCGSAPLAFASAAIIAGAMPARTADDTRAIGELLVMTVFFIAFIVLMRILDKTTPRIAIDPASLPDEIAKVMEVYKVSEVNNCLVFKGKLKNDAASVYQYLKQTTDGRSTPLLQDTWPFPTIILIPGNLQSMIPRTVVRPWLHVLLGALTFASTTFVGASASAAERFSWTAILMGLQYSIPLMIILVVHELGHYVAARRHNIDVTPPFFIPVPFGLGTFGAFISMRTPAENRSTIFDVAIAGPLAGFAVALPLFLIGLHSSQFVDPGTAIGSWVWETVKVSSSALLAAVATLSFPHADVVDKAIQLSPIAKAGWIGIWLTAFNLLPIGQLDGGHVAQGMFGSRITFGITRLCLVLFLALGLFVWSGFLVWLVILWMVSSQVVPSLDDVTAIDPVRKVLGFASFMLFVAIFTPVIIGR